ncbi:MAG: hypothetical protein ACOCRW_00280 [Bacteroidota bacterium]
MDIDKLKGSWKKYTADFQSKELKNTDDLKEILKRRSQKTLKLLRRNFFIEAGLNILIIPLILLFFIKSGLLEGSLNNVFIGVILVILIIFLWYLFDAYRKIYKYEHYSLSLKEKLTHQVKSLETFIKNYYRFLYITYFLVLIVGVGFDLPEENTRMLLSIGFGVAVGLILFFLILRPLARMYVNKLYKKHILSLKKCMEELE